MLHLQQNATSHLRSGSRHLDACRLENLQRWHNFEETGVRGRAAISRFASPSRGVQSRTLVEVMQARMYSISFSEIGSTGANPPPSVRKLVVWP